MTVVHMCYTSNQEFLLTHPVWDVTVVLLTREIITEFLLTHPVWDVTVVGSATIPRIAFLLTHPVWDVTEYLVFSCRLYLISTHTSRVGCDCL